MATNNVVNSIYLPLSGGTETGNIAFNPSTAGLTGTTAADSASAGTVGEVISSSIVAASAISISNNTFTNLTSISLTAGDWDVWGNIFFIPAASTIPTEFSAAINTTSATYPDASVIELWVETFTTGGTGGVNAPPRRINVSSTTTCYIIGYTLFTVSTMTMCGNIFARRAR